MKAAPEGVIVFTRPNWKDVKAYRESENMTLGGGIGWEFLRRNPDYQKDVGLYEFEVIALCEKNTKAYIESVEDHESPEWFCSKACFHQFEQPERFEYWTQFIEQKWGLIYPYSPSDHWDGSGFIMPTLDRPETFDRVKNHQVISPRVLIPVDLSEPLEILLKKVEHQIRYFRNLGIESGNVEPVTSRVLSTAVYIEYLRILDGIEAGETLQKIGEVVSPTATNDPIEKQRDKRIRAAYTAAKKMQDGGYRALMY